MHLSNGFNGPSITGAWLAYVLATHPDVEEKLIAEIDAITGGDPDYDLQYDDLMALTYTTQVIKETLRIYPPMPVTIRRSLKDGMLGRYRIRKGDIILVGALAAQRDPRYWGPNADVFDPDQFAMEKVVDRPRHAFIPFSIGKRQCMAQEVTFMMLRVVLFEIYNRYRLRLAPGATVAKNTVVTTKPAAVPSSALPRERGASAGRAARPRRAERCRRRRAAGASRASGASRRRSRQTSAYRHLVIAYGSNFGANKELAERFAERSRFYGYTQRGDDAERARRVAAAHRSPGCSRHDLHLHRRTRRRTRPRSRSWLEQTAARLRRRGATAGTSSGVSATASGTRSSPSRATCTRKLVASSAPRRSRSFAFGDVGSPAWETRARGVERPRLAGAARAVRRAADARRPPRASPPRSAAAGA